MNYDPMDLLAWVILAAFYVLCAMPIVGSWFNVGSNDYTEDLKIGASIHVVLLILSGVVFAIAWAYIRVAS